MPKVAEFSSKFLKNLNKLEVSKAKLIKSKIKDLLQDSTIGIPLQGNLKSLWKLRVGKIRIIYRFDNEKVYFVTLDYRKRVYKK